jgi:hypothetical protein
MNLYEEMKQIVREPYSSISKQFDGQFKHKSVEGYVEMRERILHRKKLLEIQKFNLIHNPRRIEHLLDKLVTLHKIKTNMKPITTYQTPTNHLTNTNKSPPHLDNTISPIFLNNSVTKSNETKKRSIFSDKMKVIQERTINKVRNRKKEIANNNNRTYNPNYDTIYTKSPMYTFSTSPKKQPIKKIIYQNLCSKYNKHEKYFNMNKTTLKSLSTRNTLLLNKPSLTIQNNISQPSLFTKSNNNNNNKELKHISIPLLTIPKDNFNSTTLITSLSTRDTKLKLSNPHIDSINKS